MPSSISYFLFPILCAVSLLATATCPAATLFDSLGFEAPTYSLGLLDGQNGWNSVGSSTAGVVQTNVVSSGSQAVMLLGATTAWQFPSLEYTPLAGEIVRISFDVRRSAFTSVNNFGYFVDVYNTSAEGAARIARTGLVRTGSPTAPGNVQALVTIGGGSPGSYLIGTPLLNDTWYSFVVDLNFASNTWSLTINGSTVACTLPFATPSLGIGDADLQISATGGSTDAGFFDNYLVEIGIPPEPAINCPLDKLVNCGDSTDPTNTGTATITGTFSQPVAITSSDAPTPSNCTGLAGIDRTWTARDACGLELSCVQHITVVDTNPPALTCPTNRLLVCGDSTATNNTGIATATDACSGVASITFSDLRTNGISAGNYIIARTWAATDNCGNTATCTQTITVIDTNGPVLICPLDVTNECSVGITTNVTGVATATDDCSGVASISYVDVRPDLGCTGSYLINRTWTAIDTGSNSSSCIQKITVIDTTPPVITCPSNLTLSCASLVPAPDTNSVTASDDCGGAVTISFVGDSISSSNCANHYTITRTYRAADLCGNGVTCQQIITVNDLNAPVISCPPDMAVSCSSEVPPPDTSKVTASDACGGPVTIGFVADSISSSNCANRYTITRTYQATDLCGNSTICSNIIRVRGDILPTLQGVPTNLVLACGEPLPAPPTVTATAGCGALPLVVYLNSVTNAPNGLLAGYYVTNCWTAIDECGNAVQGCQLVTFLTCLAPICVVVFDDVNTDGVQNNGEIGITNWQIRVTGTNYNRTNYTSSGGSTCFDNLAPGAYTVTELPSKTSIWLSTTTNRALVQMQGIAQAVKFGNVCIGAGGSPGTSTFWGSKNGLTVMSDPPNGASIELALLSSLCLRTAGGADFNPKVYPALRNWLESVSSTTNAAYMLSVQLACMELNVESARSSGTALIYSPGTTSANAAGFASVNAVMNEANALLCRKGIISPADPERAYANALTAALTNANLNTSFVQPLPCVLSLESNVGDSALEPTPSTQ